MSQIIPAAAVKTHLNQVTFKLRWFSARGLTHHFLSEQKYLTLKPSEHFPGSQLFYPVVGFHPMICPNPIYQLCVSPLFFLGKCFQTQGIGSKPYYSWLSNHCKFSLKLHPVVFFFFFLMRKGSPSVGPWIAFTFHRAQGLVVKSGIKQVILNVMGIMRGKDQAGVMEPHQLQGTNI